jgi:predicted small lipoprotein YifL
MHHAFASLLVAVALATAACGSKQSPPAATPGPANAQPQQGSPLTAESCTAAGGEVVGDIGDGAIHRPEYRCPNSGQPPLGPIAPEPGEPIAIEGAVCCR